MNLSTWQRVKRRFGLSVWGGSYEHPDGRIELDFDEKAGVDPTVDTEDVQDEKLDRYFRRQKQDAPRTLGPALVGMASIAITSQLGMPLWQMILVAVLVGGGLHLMITGRWPR